MGKKKARAPRLPNGNGLLQKSENVNREELLKEAISKLGNGDSNGNGKDKKNPRTDTLLKDKKHEKDIHPKLDRQHIEQISGVIDAAELLRVLTEVKNGNFNVRMPLDQVGISGKICDTLNDIIDTNQSMMEEFTRAGNTIGRQGNLNQRIELPATKGAWATGVESLNRLIDRKSTRLNSS